MNRYLVILRAQKLVEEDALLRLFIPLITDHNPSPITHGPSMMGSLHSEKALNGFYTEVSNRSRIIVVLYMEK